MNITQDQFVQTLNNFIVEDKVDEIERLYQQGSLTDRARLTQKREINATWWEENVNDVSHSELVTYIAKTLEALTKTERH